MRRFASFLTAFGLVASGLVLSPANAATPVSGEYVCTTGLIRTAETTNLYSITDGVVSDGASCAGSVVIPPGVTSIGESAFYGAASLTSINIPASALSIDNQAFYEATELASVTFGSGSKLTNIGNFAFFRSTKLASISIPAGVTSIGEAAFQEATKLASVTFGSGSKLTSIGDSAFSVATSLTSINIPAGVTSVSGSAFYNATKLASVTFESGSKLTNIGNYAFYAATSLTSISTPASVTSIGERAFYGATSLNRAYFLGNAPTVGNEAFGSVASGAKAYITPHASGFRAVGTRWNGLVVTIGVKAKAKVKPSIFGTAKVSNTLTAKKGGWTGVPEPTISYQWYSCSKKVTTAKSSVPSYCKKITGATKSTLKLAQAQEGKFIAVFVTGTSGVTSSTKWLSKSTAKVK